MNDRCRTYRYQLADVAEGRGEPEAVRHVEGCPRCAELVRRYQAIRAAGKISWESAPADLVARAKALVGETRRRLVARRMGSSLLAGARGGVDEFQVMVGAEEVSVRLMATREGSGWQLMGRLPSPDWKVESRHAVEMERDGFRLNAPSLEDSAFRLIGPELEIEVPSLADILGEE